ncbi:MAG: MFS transporter [Thermoplasmata archaeon]|nr:MFS transporter [Thermoplasmata archaeon]
MAVPVERTPHEAVTPNRGGVWSVPAFRAVFGSQVTSALGGAISSVSVSWLVYHVTGSSLDIAYVGLAGVIPGIVLGLLAGVLADRYNRRRLMVACDLSRMAAMAGLAVFLAVVGFSLFLILAVMVVVFSFTAVFTPASQAILPRLVPTAALEGANGLLNASTQLAYLVGSAGGGLLVAFAGAVLGLGANAITFGLSAVLILQIGAQFGQPIAASTGTRPSFASQLSEGLRYMRDHRPILEVTVGFMPANFLFMMVAGFLVVYATSRFGADPAAYGYLLAALSAGGVVGALAVGRLHPRRVAGSLMGASVLLQGGVVGVLAFATKLPVSLVAATVGGLCLGLINTVYFATMQAIVPNEILARVLSIDSVGSFAAIPGGLLTGGLLAARYGITDVYWIAAVGLALNGLVMLSLPDVRRLGQNAGAPPTAPDSLPTRR